MHTLINHWNWENFVFFSQQLETLNVLNNLKYAGEHSYIFSIAASWFRCISFLLSSTVLWLRWFHGKTHDQNSINQNTRSLKNKNRDQVAIYWGCREHIFGFSEYTYEKNPRTQSNAEGSRRKGLVKKSRERTFLLKFLWKKWNRLCHIWQASIVWCQYSNSVLREIYDFWIESNNHYKP